MRMIVRGVGLGLALVAFHASATTADTSVLQGAIDSAWKAGGGKVVVPSGVHHVGGLRLRSNVELHLASNAVLSASRNCDDFEILTGFPIGRPR